MLGKEASGRGHKAGPSPLPMDAGSKPLGECGFGSRNCVLGSGPLIPLLGSAVATAFLPTTGAIQLLEVASGLAVSPGG